MAAERRPRTPTLFSPRIAPRGKSRAVRIWCMAGSTALEEIAQRMSVVSSRLLSGFPGYTGWVAGVERVFSGKPWIMNDNDIQWSIHGSSRVKLWVVDPPLILGSLWWDFLWRRGRVATRSRRRIRAVGERPLMDIAREKLLERGYGPSTGD